MTSFEQLPQGESGLVSARPGPDLDGHGYVEHEYVVRGSAASCWYATASVSARCSMQRCATARCSSPRR